MKTFEEVKREMDVDFQDCLMTMEEFLECYDSRFFISSDGVGDVHDGNYFITDGFDTDIFDFLSEKLSEMSRDEVIKRFPYVAWFNK